VAACLYHMCAADFRGEVLYPLSGLRSIYPDLYERERVKYEGREGVLRYVVPGLGVTWTETVNLSALHPKYLVAERRRLGVPFSNLLTRRVLEIPIERLSGHNAVAYASSAHWINSSPNDPTAPTEPPIGDFYPFDAATHSEPTNVPPLHTEYLLRQLSLGERALGFVFIPHVLVASAIDVSGLVPRGIADN
jgi:hypothetical protein